jgi:predicted transcriptional regulator
VSYHVRQLEKAGLIELVATKPRRGALEHYYTLA